MTSELERLDFGIDDLPGDALHGALAGFRRRGPVAPTRFFGAPAWLITSHAALAAAFRDAERFPPQSTYQLGIERVIGRTFISMDEPDHQTFRRLATTAFRFHAIERQGRDEIAALAHELIDRLAHRTEAELVADFAARFPYLVITRLLGLPREREGDFHAWALGLLRFRDDPARAERANRALTDYLAPIVAERRRRPCGDVISELAHATIDGRGLSDAEIHAHVRLLFPTGGETTHGTLGNLVWAVLAQGDKWARLREDPTLCAGAVDEILRWESSIAVLPRRTPQVPIEHWGATLPADAWVLFAIAGANRDPAVFEDPDRFDPTRDTGEALTFGPGPKHCPGMHLARRNLTVALEVLVERLPDLRLLDEPSARPRRTVLRSPDALHVALR